MTPAHKNRMSGFKDKALAMRLLQDSIGAWGTDVLYVYHLQSGRDANAQEVTTATVSRTELARLQRSLNVQLRVVEDNPPAPAGPGGKGEPRHPRRLGTPGAPT